MDGLKQVYDWQTWQEIGGSISYTDKLCVLVPVLVLVLCCFFINRCQCGAVLAEQSMAANVTNKKKRERVIGRKQQNQHQIKKKKEKTLAEPQTSYCPCPCILCPCITDKMYGKRCVDLLVVIL